MRWTGQSRRGTELGLGSHGPLDVGGRHVIFVAAMAARRGRRRWRRCGEGGGNGSGAARAERKGGGAARAAAMVGWRGQQDKQYDIRF